jgi:hypothetical protein
MGSGGVLMGTHDAGVHADDPFDGPAVVVNLGFGQNPFPGAVIGPPPQTFMRGAPRPVSFRQIPPGRARAQLSEDPVDHLPVISPPARPATRLGQQR